MSASSLARSAVALAAALAIAAAAGQGLPAQNLVKNGSFESASGGCQFNLTNAEFTAAVEDATAFGSGEELDLLRSATGCGRGALAKNGVTKVGIHTRIASGTLDAFSLDLAATVAAGTAYSLSFWVEPNFEFDPDLGVVEVGLSADRFSFGTLIFSGSGTTGGGWTQLTHGFTAPLSAGYLTVRGDIRNKSWNFVDDFVLVQGGGCSVRNGSGINVLGFSCLTPPQLGTTWTTAVPTSPETVSAHLGLSAAPSPGVPVLSGELLLGAPVFFFASTGTFPLPLPAEPTLAGAAVYAQGFRIDHPITGPALVFFNALDVILGM